MNTPPLKSNSPRKQISRRRWYHKVALLAGSLLVAIIVAEVVMRISGKVRNVGPSFSDYDAVYGKRLKESYSCRRQCPEFEMTFSTNSYGWRGPEPAGSLEHGIVFIGDSFTMGYGVNDGEEFPRRVGTQLRERLGREVPIVNTGMGNNGNGRWIKFLRHEVERYAPNLVVFQVCGNDYNDNTVEGLFLLSDDGEIIEHPVPEIGGARKMQRVIEAIPGLSYSHLFCFAKKAVKSRGGGTSVEATAPAEAASTRQRSRKEKLGYALIEESLGMAVAKKWPILILSVDDEALRNAELARRCNKLGLELIVIPDRKARPDLYYVVDGHWNADGHAYVADVLVERILADSKLLLRYR
jgi:hypothetical protein